MWVEFKNELSELTGFHPSLITVNADEVIAVTKKEKYDFVTLELSSRKSLTIFGYSYNEVIDKLGIVVR